jgi:thiol-disulfide isomerase/thioredoxin
MKLLMLILFILNSLPLANFESSVEVKEINEDLLNNLIKNRNGKILLINVWAAWCIPCREEFPDLVKLAYNYKDDLDVIAISVDYKDEIETKVKPFLIQNKVLFPVYISVFKKDDELINYFNDKWNGALPGTFIYDSSGNQVNFMEGKHSYESFSSIIKILIEKTN